MAEVVSCPLVSGLKFQVSSFKFQVSSFRFQVSGFKFQVLLVSDLNLRDHWSRLEADCKLLRLETWNLKLLKLET